MYPFALFNYVHLFIFSQVLELDGFDEKFVRTWEYYFDYMGAGFKYCLLGDCQISEPSGVRGGHNLTCQHLKSMRTGSLLMQLITNFRATVFSSSLARFNGCSTTC